MLPKYEDDTDLHWVRDTPLFASEVVVPNLKVTRTCATHFSCSKGVENYVLKSTEDIWRNSMTEIWFDI